MNVMSELRARSQHLLMGGAIVVALAVGYGVARYAAPASAPIQETQKPEEEHEEEEGVVEMDEGKITLAGIVLTPAIPGALSAQISAQGSVVSQPSGEAVLAARADGTITSISKRIGDQVQAGEIVAMVESRDASTIAADRASTAARALAAKQAFEREQRLFDEGITPRQDLETAQAAKAQADAEAMRASAAASAVGVSSDGRRLALVSPIAGRVTAATAVIGTYVPAGTEMFRISDPAKIEVQASVPAIDAQRISQGDIAVIESASASVQAFVRSITPGVDARSRAASVLLTIKGSATSLRPGQAVRVRISGKSIEDQQKRVVVPEEAIQTVEGREVVFVRNKEGFLATPVTVGGRSGGRAEILSGLSVGQTVAGNGSFLLKAELGKGAADHH